MTTFLLIIHVLVSLFLIFIVLVQGGKGAELGAAFGGGSSQTLFGGRGAATFLGKLTTLVAVVFMLTSMLLALASVKSGSVIQKTVPAAERPTTPTQAPGAPGSPVSPAGVPEGAPLEQSAPITPTPPPGQ